jgi:hypothetical protein
MKLLSDENVKTILWTISLVIWLIKKWWRGEPLPTWSSEELETIFKNCRSSKPINNIADRITQSAMLFNNNKLSDEYYTPKECWASYIKTRGLENTEAFEPFSGDGMPLKELGQLVRLKTMDTPWNFYDKITRKDCPQEHILTNPPFSFKYHVISTLLERKRNFSMILPWQAFIGGSTEPRPRTWVYDEYEKKYGGTWRWYKLKGSECEFKQPQSNGSYKTKKVGCHILEWDFDNKYNGGRLIERL